MENQEENVKNGTGPAGNNSRPAALILLLVILGTVACDPSLVYSESISVPDARWSKDQKVAFQVAMKDTLKQYDIRFNLRTGSSYPYQNLFLFITTTAPSGARITDTVEYFLADNSGKWLGKGVGDIHELNVPYKKQVRFPEYGTYTFSIVQGMRTDQLRGIYDLGFSIHYSEQNR